MYDNSGKKCQRYLVPYHKEPYMDVELQFKCYSCHEEYEQFHGETLHSEQGSLTFESMLKDRKSQLQSILKRGRLTEAEIMTSLTWF